MKSVAFALACAALCVSASPARTLAETLSKLQQAAFEDPATGDAIVASLRSHAPSFHSAGKVSLASIPEYPFAEQTEYQAHSPDVIHINFDMPRGASFVQRAGGDIDGLFRSYKQIGETVGAFEKSQTLSDSDIRDAVARANEGEAGNTGAGCPECGFHQEAASATKPVLEVRLAAPKVEPWESLISGLIQQREQMEAKLMTQFREMFAKRKGASFMQKEDVRVKVGAMQQVDPSLVSLVVEAEAQRNQQELSMLKSAVAALSGKASFLQGDFDVKVGQGSRPFERFSDAVRNMETLRHASEQRIRSQIVSMMSSLHQ